MSPRKTPVEALEDDELFKLLVAGTATPEDCQFAAKWIRILTSMLTDAQNQRMRDGYDIGDAVDPERKGQMRAALCNAISDRIITLTEALSPLNAPKDIAKALLEITLLAELYPKDLSL